MKNRLNKTMNRRAILIWRFADCPSVIKSGAPRSARHLGWIAFVPASHGGITVFIEAAGIAITRTRFRPTFIDTDKAIRVWDFNEAPSEFVHSLGGDEDWVAHVPAVLGEGPIPWIVQGSSFGCCSVFEFPQENGSTVRIGTHS